jgi:hypothetical protein
MPRLKSIMLFAGLTLVAIGYWQLAVPPDSPYQIMLERARNGMLSTLSGGLLLIIMLVQKD